ncbi:hypothetical protein ABKV19_023160 [Rosa sericea]
MNKNLAKNYVYTRTATDVFYLVDFFISKCGCCCCRGRRSSKSCVTKMLSIMSRIFVSLPIAQIYAAGGGECRSTPFY